MLFRRGAVFYCEDTSTRQQTSLRTKDQAEAQTLIHSKNEAFRQPTLNLQIARTYLSATDPEVGKRVWKTVMEEMSKTMSGATLRRHLCAIQDHAFDLIRDKPILETQAVDFLHVLKAGTVSTNVFLRRIHNFALGVNWLPWPILPKKQWPKLSFKEKRAITEAEHQMVLSAERNPERRAFYECCWILGGSQTDIAFLCAEDVDRKARVVSFRRRKTDSACIVRFGDELERVLDELPKINCTGSSSARQARRSSAVGY